MDWEKYRIAFSKEAERENYNQKEISGFLEYARKLFDKELPIIFNLEHFSKLVGYNIDFIIKACNNSQSYYRTFTIPKKTGTLRVISEPLPNLKDIQNWILINILYSLNVSKYAKAYVPKRSIKENARFHKNQEMVLKLDIQDFFTSIKFKKVLYFFRSIGYNRQVSVVMAKLCCLNDSLPQGAPTSPALSNLLFYKLDNRLAHFTRKYDIRYTRYADDLTFSGSFAVGQLINFVEKILRENKFILNKQKTRLMRKHERQIVTGIIVNNKILKTGKEVKKKLRQEMYYIGKYGLGSHLNHTSQHKANYLKHLLGICNYIIFIEPNNMEVKKYKEYIYSYGLIK